MAVEFLKMSFSIIKWVVLVNISGNGMMFDAGITNGATTASSVDSLTPSLPNWGPTDCWWKSSSSIHHLFIIIYHYPSLCAVSAGLLLTDRSGGGKDFLAKITKNGLNQKRKKISGWVQRLCGARVHTLRWSFEKNGVPLKKMDFWPKIRISEKCTFYR